MNYDAIERKRKEENHDVIKNTQLDYRPVIEDGRVDERIQNQKYGQGNYRDPEHSIYRDKNTNLMGNRDDSCGKANEEL